jgi:hypothetical protein
VTNEAAGGRLFFFRAVRRAGSPRASSLFDRFEHWRCSRSFRIARSVRFVRSARGDSCHAH